MLRHILAMAIASLALAGFVRAQPADGQPTIRICDSNGCSERPRNASTFDATADDNPEETRRVAALTELAKKEPRAAYDLGLRYFRGDGVRQNSYQAIQWMRDAGERGDLRAQAALGRFYLMGLEEMGSDPQEAEKWLSIAAGRGDKESAALLKEASAAKKRNQDAYRDWVNLRRSAWYGYWASGYRYYWTWGPGGWYFRY